MSKKYDAGFFDEQFFTGEDGTKGAYRGSDSATYVQAANAVSIAFPPTKSPPTKVLVVGAGLGWTSKHLEEKGYEVWSSDIAPYAVEHAVVPSFVGDIRDMKTFEPVAVVPFDLVVCDRVLAYLPEEDIPQALLNLRLLAPKLYVAVITTDHDFHSKQYVGRLTIKPMSWWADRLSEARLFTYAPGQDRLGNVHPTWRGIYCLTDKPAT